MRFSAALAGHSANAPLPLGLMPAWQKLAAAAVFAVCVSLLRGHVLALSACLVPVLLAVAGRVPLRPLLKRLLPVNFFFIFLWLALPLELSSGGVALSRSGLELAALITLKGNSIAAVLIILAGTSSVTESCRGLLTLRVPEKFVALLLLTFTNLANMRDEYARLSAAARLRGFAPSSSPAGYRTIAYLAAMLLLRSWQRAQRVGSGMRLRGFSGRFPLLQPGGEASCAGRGKLLLAGMCVVSAMLVLAQAVLW